MGIERQSSNISPTDKQYVDPNERAKKNQKRTDKLTAAQTPLANSTNTMAKSDASLTKERVHQKPFPKSLSLFTPLSVDRTVTEATAKHLKPGRIALFADLLNSCLMVQTKTTKFKYIPSEGATYKGPRQNPETGKWTKSKQAVTLHEVLTQFGGITDLLSLEQLPLANQSAAHKLSPGQFVLLRTKDNDVLAVKKTAEGNLEQTLYKHDTLPGTFIEKKAGIDRELQTRVSFNHILYAQGGIENLCLHTIASSAAPLKEPLPSQTVDLPYWPSLTWDTLMGDFKVGEFVLYQNAQDNTVVVCMNKGKRGTTIDKATNKEFYATHLASFSLKPVKKDGKEQYVDAHNKTYSSLDALITSLGGKDNLRYDKLYAAYDERRHLYELTDD